MNDHIHGLLVAAGCDPQKFELWQGQQEVDILHVELCSDDVRVTALKRYAAILQEHYDTLLVEHVLRVRRKGSSFF